MNSHGADNALSEISASEITKSIEHWHANANVKRVLICRPNHRLGNLLLITPLVQEITDAFPDCKIDLFIKGGLGPILFKNYETVDKIIQLPKSFAKRSIAYLRSWMSIRRSQYDLVIDVDKNSSSGRLASRLANGKHKISGSIVESMNQQFKDYHHHAKFPVYNFRNWLAGLELLQKDKPIPSLNLKLTSAEIARGKALLEELVHGDGQTISLFTFATGKKCYSEAWWEKFYRQLKSEFPHHNFVEILPVENISKLSFKIPAFYSKDVREIASVIANTAVFIGADSGIMHLASAAQAPTVGLFSVTDPKLYAPYGNDSTGINTNVVDTDECMRIIRNIIYHEVISTPVVES